MTVIEKFLRAISKRFVANGIGVERFQLAPQPNVDGEIEINYTLVYNRKVYTRCIHFPWNFDGDINTLADKIKAQVDVACAEIKAENENSAEQMKFCDIER